MLWVNSWRMTDDISEDAAQRDSVMRALARVAAQGDKFEAAEPGSRESLIEAARDLLAAAESPVESLLWSIWSLPTRTVAARIAIDLQIFQTATQDGSRPKSIAELAAPTKAAPELVERIARVCVSMGMLDEQGPEAYIPNRLTHALACPEYAGSIIFCFDCTQLSFARLPEYLRSIRFQNPQDATSGPFQFANQWEGHAFDWLTGHPEVFQAFHGFVYTLRAHRPSWFDMYPVKDRLIERMNVGGSSSALVDVGGGMGQTLEDFRVHVPEYTGELVLQDLAEVIEVARKQRLDARISLQAHDFFTPQPVKGARAYFMRSVLHDWPDDACRKILGHLKDAMEPGYSRILISDCVVSNEKAAWQHVSLDIFMMALASAQERTEHQWYNLIESCGLKISGIYSKGVGNESLIEVVAQSN
ncbi:S-adenosyl-L-methionine-dependent methyltransferase [Hypoxylon argillaceum]|nr:S-adenosyl-L-methionine-dependent methyltransferase [Hypoxylon argillaceum]